MEITIDDYTFELLYKTTYEGYDLVVMKCLTTNTDIILYRSKSGLDTWHYAKWRVDRSFLKIKDGDLFLEYITGTFIHMELQKKINEKYNHIKYIEDIKNIEDIKHIEVALATKLSISTNKKYKHYNKLKRFKDIFGNITNENRDKYIDNLQYFRETRSDEICTNTCQSFKKLYLFLGVDGIALFCGRIIKFKNNYANNTVKIREFIQEHELHISLPVNETDTLMIYKYMMSIIYQFLKKNFRFEKTELYYKYTYSFKKTRKTGSSVDIQITIYQSIIYSELNIKYYYYYIKYNYELQDYYAPLFITPLLSKINKYGMYECFMQSSIYFCKIFEYNSNLYEKGDNRYNKYDPYEFIGYLISEFTLLPPRKQILTLTSHDKLFYFVSNDDTNKIKYEEYLQMVKAVIAVGNDKIPRNSKKHVYIDNTYHIGTYHTDADSSYIYYHLTNVLKCDSRDEEPYIELQEVSGINRIDEIDISKIKDECFLKYEEESCSQMVGGYKSNILTGNRGGKYIILKGKKRYIKNRK